MKNKILIIAILLVGFVGRSFGQKIVFDNKKLKGIELKMIKPNGDVKPIGNNTWLKRSQLYIIFNDSNIDSNEFKFNIEEKTEGKWILSKKENYVDFEVLITQNKDDITIDNDGVFLISNNNPIEIKIKLKKEKEGLHVLNLMFKNKNGKVRRVKVKADIPIIEPKKGIIEFRGDEAELTNGTKIDFSDNGDVNTVTYTLPIKYTGESEANFNFESLNNSDLSKNQQKDKKFYYSIKPVDGKLSEENSNALITFYVNEDYIGDKEGNWNLDYKISFEENDNTFTGFIVNNVPEKKEEDNQDNSWFISFIKSYYNIIISIILLIIMGLFRKPIIGLFVRQNKPPLDSGNDISDSLTTKLSNKFNINKDAKNILDRAIKGSDISDEEYNVLFNSIIGNYKVVELNEELEKANVELSKLNYKNDNLNRETKELLNSNSELENQLSLQKKSLKNKDLEISKLENQLREKDFEKQRAIKEKEQELNSELTKLKEQLRNKDAEKQKAIETKEDEFKDELKSKGTEIKNLSISLETSRNETKFYSTVAKEALDSDYKVGDDTYKQKVEEIQKWKSFYAENSKPEYIESYLRSLKLVYDFAKQAKAKAGKDSNFSAMIDQLLFSKKASTEVVNEIFDYSKKDDYLFNKTASSEYSNIAKAKFAKSIVMNGDGYTLFNTLAILKSYSDSKISKVANDFKSQVGNLSQLNEAYKSYVNSLKDFGVIIAELPVLGETKYDESKFTQSMFSNLANNYSNEIAGISTGVVYDLINIGVSFDGKSMPTYVTKS